MICELRENEIDEVMELWLSVNIDAHDFIHKKYWLDNYDVVKKQYIPLAKTYVYKENDEIKGFISILEGSFIGALFVKADRQGQGIGRKLLDYSKRIYLKLELAVYVENIHAIAFYQKCDFKKIIEQNNESSGIKEYIMMWEVK
jgi:putative acetyltransferase